MNPNFQQLAELASRAPSGHNTQPWLFSQEGDAFVIRPDFSKALPVVDPNHRELYISLGCAAENVLLASGKQQLTIDNGQKQLTIKIPEEEIVNYSSSIVNSIAVRQTNRSLYTGQSIPTESLSALTAVRPEPHTHFYLWEKGSEPFKQLETFIQKGNEIQMGNPDFLNELKSWIRYNKRQAEATRDGLSYAAFGAPNLPAFLSKAIMECMLKSSVQNRSDRQKLASASHIALFTTQEDTVEEWIRLGQTLQRFLLAATQEGIVTAFINPPCEVRSLAKEIRETFPIHREHPTLLLRLGYAKPMPYSLRRPIAAV